MTARKHEHLKLLAATSRADRAVLELSVFLAMDKPPPPPSWMANIEAVKEWNRLAPVLVANQLLNTGNINVFAQLCAIHGHLIKAWATNTPPTAALISAYRGLSSELGLLGMAIPIGKPDKANRFANHANQRKGV